MQDSITVANLTAGADAYLGYVDGHWPTYQALAARFPHAHLVSMAVFPSDNAIGCDREPGDLDVNQIAGWVKRQLARGVWRPIVYASASNMGACLVALAVAGIGRAQVRLLAAHYGEGNHICGPDTCREPGCPACDGTQWTDTGPGTNGTHIDVSALAAGFFGEDDMPLTAADIAAVAKATAQQVWTADGLIAGPDGNKDNRFWSGARSVGDLGVQVRALQSSVAAVAAKTGVDPATVVAGVLKGLNPATLADAIATELGADVGQDVVTALQARLAAPPK